MKPAIPQNANALPAKGRRLMTTILILLLIGYLVIVAIFAIFQNKLLYFPTHGGPSPERLELINVEEVSFKTSDGLTLNGWYAAADAQAPTLLYFHGNAGNIAGRQHLIVMAQNMGWGMLLFDYRGYGNSQGSPSEQGLYRDAEAAWQWVSKEKTVNSKNLVYYAQSLGCAVALELACHHTPAAIILESPFTSLKQLAHQLYPWLPTGLLLRNRFDNLEKIRLIHCPVLIAHGRRDEIVPFQHGQTLYAAALGPKQFVECESMHNDLFESGGSAYLKTLNQFVETYGRGK